MLRSTRWLVVLAAALMLMVNAGAPVKAQGKAPTPQVIITAAEADPGMTTLFLSGVQFAPGAAVYLSGTQLGGVVVSSGGTALSASLPAGVLPGSYRVFVVQGNGTTQNATFDVTLGNSGAQGDAGPAGPPGATGATGIQGAPGGTGAQGATGAQGTTGAQGATGTAGVNGVNGLNGAQGPIGPTGATGPQGPAGDGTIQASVNMGIGLGDRTGWTHVENLGDDICFLSIPLGFTFTGWGLSITQFSLSSNGVLFFGPACNPAPFNDPLPTALSSNPLLAFFWDDLRDFGSGEYLEYATQGTPGGRVFSMYFRNRLFADCGSDSINVMINIHEGSNIVNVSYQDTTACARIRGALATFGIQGPGGASAKAISVGNHVIMLDDSPTRQWMSFKPPQD